MKVAKWLRIIRAFAHAIEMEKQTINDLNVFPVQDGDTGTNMAGTVAHVWEVLMGLPKEASSDVVLDTIATGAQMGAMGNSGVILAAIFTGAVEALKGHDEMTVKLLIEALTNASKNARESVLEPKEGTMLTVIDEMAKAAARAYKAGETSTSQAIKEVLAAGVFATEETPKLLAELMGNIDSGAYGFSRGFQAACSVAIDEAMDWAEIDLSKSPILMNAANPELNLGWKPGTPRYCTEFLWERRNADKPTRKAIMKFLGKMGNSVVYLPSSHFTKVHVHTDEPDKVLEYFRKHGALDGVKIDDMQRQTEEHQKALEEAKASRGPAKPFGVVAVASGAGMEALMSEMEADAIINGGQTANPSAKTIVEAINSVNAELVVVLPSNKNVVLAANMACSLAESAAEVIATVNMPQSLSALMEMQAMYEPGVDLRTVIDAMRAQAMSDCLKVASVTMAYKDYTAAKGLEVTAGQLIVVVDDEVVAVGSDQDDTIVAAVKDLIGEVALADIESVTIYTGADYVGSSETLMAELEQVLPGGLVDKDVRDGGQPVYLAIVELRVAES